MAKHTGIQDMRTCPIDRPILARTIDGTDEPVQYDHQIGLWVHTDGEWSGFWSGDIFVGWQELMPDISDD